MKIMQKITLTTGYLDKTTNSKLQLSKSKNVKSVGLGLTRNLKLNFNNNP